ncbi:MAG TPA: right-handed parallel beta-helix repeat-containing protein [Mycobacterium sp.]|nr:right-handed parallel beta-helix repeat-containing protein [Mycobacterium sp.]
MPRIAIAAVLLLAACEPAPPTASRSEALSGVTTPQAFGAACDGERDDRAEIQAALSSGVAEVDITGTCLAGRAGSAAWCLSLPAGVTLRGPGALLQAGALPIASVRLLEADGAGAHIIDLTLDGNYAAQTSADEHRAGLFATAGITIEDTTFQNFSGDGLSLAGGAGYVLRSVTAIGNHRDGISCVRTVDNVLVESSHFVGNSAQQVDLEPVQCSHFSLRDSVLDGAGVSNDYVLAVARGDHFRGIGNVLNGPIDVVASHDVVLLDNTGTNATPNASLLYWGTDTVLVDNQLAATAARGVLLVSGITGAGGQPSATLLGNTLTANGAAGLVYATGSAEVTLGTGATTGNQLVCTAGSSTAVVGRATLPTYPFGRLELRGNTVSGCTRALSVSGIGGTATVSEVIGGSNWFGTAATNLDDGGQGALQSYLGDFAVSRWPTSAVLTPAGPAGTLMTRGP